MRTKPLLLILPLLSLVLQTLAQNASPVNGMVKDSTGRPIAAASVTIVNASGAGVHFTKTDANGAFDCKIPSPGDGLSLKVTALGFRPFIQTISSGRSPFLVTLSPLPTALAEVTVKSKTGIQASGDTLNYRVAAFKDKNDRVIGDLIARLPGIEVDEKGTISYNGKRISNVYIDGENLLNGRYGIATNNVPVDAVEQVQVLERDQPVKVLSGYVPADNVSLNLRLSAKARATTINTGEAGAGNDVYLLSFSNLILQQRVKSINYVKSNNAGSNLQRETADLGVSSANGATPPPQPHAYLSMTGDNLPAVDENYYLRNTDHAVNANALFKLPAEWALRLNLSALDLKRRYQFSQSVQYFLPQGDTIGYHESQFNTDRHREWQVQAQFEKNSTGAFVKSSTQLKIPSATERGDAWQNGQFMQQRLPFRQQGAGNETQIVKALGGKHLLQYNSVLQYDHVEENLYILPGLHENLVNDSVDFLQLGQRVRTEQVYVHQYTAFRIRRGRMVWSFSAGGNYERNHLRSGLQVTDSAGKLTSAGDRFSNNVTFENLGLFASANATWMLPRGVIVAEAKPAMHFIGYGLQGESGARRQEYFLLNPTLEFRKNLGRYGELQIRYGGQTSFGHVNDIYPGTILVNYRQFNANAAPLPKTGVHSAMGRFSFRKPIQMMFWQITVSAEQTRQNFLQAYTVDSGITRITAMNYDNRQSKYSAGGNYSKYIFALSLQLSAAAKGSLQTGNMWYNGDISPFHSHQFSLSMALQKKLPFGAKISVSGEAGKQEYRLQPRKGFAAPNITESVKAKAEWQQQLTGRLSITPAYQFTSYHPSGQSGIRQHFLDVQARFAVLKWKSTFELSGINLLGQEKYRQIVTTANQLSILEMPLRGRTLMVKYFFGF
ncbi:carboxypeptidase regulatory-like domain-containing protein [Chitinophaga sp. NPDC101104]|uniref:carboxypeptidase regulatory-like domain-containing protein n=1 Tax=Chitinophaga sp. NPDC101104 TaxID=3390561 RepID=UPI003D094834